MTITTSRDEILANAPFDFPESVLSFYKKGLVEAYARMNKRINWNAELLSEAGKVVRSNNESALATARIAAETFNALTRSTGQIYQSAFTSGLEISRSLLAAEPVGDRAPTQALAGVFDAQSALFKQAWLKPSQDMAQMFINSMSQPPESAVPATADTGEIVDSPAQPFADPRPERALH